VTAADNLHATAVELRALPKRVLIDIAKAAKKAAQAEGSRVGAPLQGHKRRGMKLRAYDDLRDTADGASLRVQGVNPAGWVWMTDGTRPHQIRRRKRGPKSRLSVSHPGTRGRGAWTRVAADIEQQVIPRVLREWLSRTIGS
jgi:hypothetical protein